jgi:hypothetical protein
MKSYTDLGQSYKLAEILSIDTADMWYDNDGESIAGRPEVRCGSFVGLASKNIPCWSLASLIGIIPQEIFDGEYVINITEGFYNKWVLTYDHCENRSHSYYGLSTGADNIIDACYEMIIKLKEKNLL